MRVFIWGMTMQANQIFRIPDAGGNRPEGADVQETVRMAVIGVAQGSGVSFVAGLLAAWVGQAFSDESVALVELGTPYFYEAYGIEKRFLYRDFYPFHRLVAERKNIRGLANMEQGINWILRCPGDAPPGGVHEALSPGDSLRLVHNATGTVRLFDCSGMNPALMWDILPDMDAVVCVLDPLPTRLCPYIAGIERIRIEAPRPVFVANNMNRGVHRGELRRFFRGTDWLELPHVATEDLYRAQYNCVLPYSIASVRKIVAPVLAELWDRTCGSPDALRTRGTGNGVSKKAKI